MLKREWAEFMRLFGGVVDVLQGRGTDTLATGLEDNLHLIYITRAVHTGQTIVDIKGTI